MRESMDPEEMMPPEETLDPQGWEAVRALGHRMLDDMLDYMKTVRERPVWRHIPADVVEHLNQPLPLDPQPLQDVYQEFRENVLPYPIGNIHPRFWGVVPPASNRSCSSSRERVSEGLATSRELRPRSGKRQRRNCRWRFPLSE